MRDRFGIFGAVIRIRKLSLLLVMMLRIPNTSDDHGDDGDDHKMIKCSTWKRRKRKTKPIEIKAKVLLRVLVLVIKTP